MISGLRPACYMRRLREPNTDTRGPLLQQAKSCPEFEGQHIQPSVTSGVMVCCLVLTSLLPPVVGSWPPGQHWPFWHAFVCVSISSSTPVFPTLLHILQDYTAWVISWLGKDFIQDSARSWNDGYTCLAPHDSTGHRSPSFFQTIPTGHIPQEFTHQPSSGPWPVVRSEEMTRFQ